MKTYCIVELYRDKKKEWRWRLVASNGRIMADSAEGYKTRSGVKRAAWRVEEAFCDLPTHEVKDDRQSRTSH